MLITYVLLGITITVSLYILNRPKLLNTFVHFPYMESNKKEISRLLTT